MGIGMLLRVIGTIFLVASAFNANIPGTSSLGIGASLWAISVFIP